MKKSNLLILAIVVLFGLFGCTKNEETTVVLVGTEPYVPNIEEIIPSELLDQITFLPQGPIPPDITGEYIADPYTLSYSNVSYDIVGQARKSRYIKFEHQFNRICRFYTKQATESMSADTVYITGSDKYFTAYFVNYVTDDTYHTKSKTANVLTGCITNEGIKGFTYGWMLMDKIDPEEILVPIGSIRIFKDEDDMASNHQWYY